LAGYAIAYGDPHLVGTRYYLGVNMQQKPDYPEVEEDVAGQYMIYSVSAYVVSVLAVSSMNERASIPTQLIFGVIV